MKRKLSFLIATWFGSGYAPIAPGTFGTLATIPLAWLLGRLPWQGYTAVTVAIIGLGIWAAHQVVLALGREDPQIVVIDEVAGYLLTLLAVPRDALHLGVAFFLFRLLDIWKPGPIRWIDRHVPGGLGVVLDDVLAGLVGAAIMVGLDALGMPRWFSHL